MITLGYLASHEQFAPSSLLEYVRHAESAGFDAAMCSDHFHPWTEAQGESAQLHAGQHRFIDDFGEHVLPALASG